MRKFNVGDVVNWINPLSDGAHYLVACLHPEGFHGAYFSVRLTKMDGSGIHFLRFDGVPIEHEWIQERRLRLEPFLTAARKAVTDAKSR